LPSGTRFSGKWSLVQTPDQPADFLLALSDGPMPPWPHRRVNWPDFYLRLRIPAEEIAEPFSLQG
ncbi:MAG TPA: hypothetical protein VG015_01425, partial [Candidatus Dormibacteraeota bacterium]|nr:hypothetical protein [Candidatus Dormibacteraeota bacterium]